MSLMSDERIPTTHMDGINKWFLESLTPYHVIAYMVGKNESDEDLLSKMYEEARSFIATINPTLPGFLAAYQTFCKLMARLLTCPSSSAGLERVFSSFGLVLTKLRNRLSNKHVENLVGVRKS